MQLAAAAAVAQLVTMLTLTATRGRASARVVC
jgi:hypothetical protein